MSTGPIRIAVVDDYEVVVAGLAHMFDRYRDRIDVVELAADRPVDQDVDIALLDTFAASSRLDDIAVLVANPHAAKVVVYTWAFRPEAIRAALGKGASGYLSKTLTAAQIVDALERIHAGEVVVSDPPSRNHPVGQDWPGREEGLTERESEILALITQGMNNAEIAAATYLSPNSVKTYIRSAYAKLGITSRTNAVLWGVEHGLHLDVRSVDSWR